MGQPCEASISTQQVEKKKNSSCSLSGPICLHEKPLLELDTLVFYVG